MKGVAAFKRIVDRTVSDVGQELETDRTFGDQVLELTVYLWKRVVAETGNIVRLKENEVEASAAHALLLFVGSAALILEKDIERTAHQTRAQRKQAFHYAEGVGNFQVGHNEKQRPWFCHSQFRASGIQLYKVFHRPNFIFAEWCGHVMDGKAMLRSKLLDGVTNITWVQGIVCMGKVGFDWLLPPILLH